MTSTSPSLTVTKVNDVDNDFHMGTWINTGLYAQVWKAIAVKGDYADYDWSAKLVARISLLPISPTGGFLANCAEGVECGFFDNLEVFSQTAFSILLANVDTCKTKTVKNWKVGIHMGKSSCWDFGVSYLSSTLLDFPLSSFSECTRPVAGA